MKVFSALLVLAAALAFASAEFLTAYDQCGGKGTKYSIPIPGKFTYDDISQLNANDKINYIELPPGYTITVYEGNIEDPQYKKQTFSSGQICLTGTPLANVLSSLVVKADKPSTAVVEGYERCDSNNQGQKWTFPAPGTVPFVDINGAGANDRINFVRVPKGYKITLFEHHLNQGKVLSLPAGDHCLIGTPLQGVLSSFYTETVDAPVDAFDRTHDELKGVYKLLTELEAKLAKQLQASNDDVSAKQAALNAASQAQSTAQSNYNTALSALNEAKRKTEAAQAALAQATDDRSKLIDTIRKELALIKKLKEIIGHQHCDDIVRGDSCYKVVKTSGVGFKAALDACNAWGGFPASIEDSEENAFIKSKLSADCHSAWIGGTDENSEGKWRWLDGTKWTYSNWAPGEPNNVNNPGHRAGENYLEMYADTGLWNDITETFENRAKCYVCKK